MNKPLWSHQLEAIRRAETQPDLGLLMEMGTGKTRTMIEVIRRRFAHKGQLRKTLILCPAIIRDNWKSEFKMFSKISQRDIVVLKDSQTRRVKEFVEATGPQTTDPKVIITNYEALEMDELFELFLRWRPEILVCDESQRLKNHKSKRAKKTAILADITEHNYILTGTPILNTPADLYMQFRILDRGATFGKNYFSFQAQYFYDANAQWKSKQNYFPKWMPRPESFPILQDKIKTRSIRVLAKDCLDLPPLVRSRVEVDLSKEQRRIYKEMYSDFVAFLAANDELAPIVVAQLAVTKSLRLQQIVSGYIVDDRGKIHRIKDNPRLDALEELVKDITPNDKVIVWAAFKENYKMISEMLEKNKIGYREIHGDISDKEKQLNMHEFRTDDTVRVMVANQSAGGVGVNLVEARYSIYYSKGFKLEDDLQSEKRNHRQGSQMHDKVLRIDLTAPGTIDELVDDALANKQSISDRILTWKEQMCRL